MLSQNRLLERRTQTFSTMYPQVEKRYLWRRQSKSAVSKQTSLAWTFWKADKVYILLILFNSRECLVLDPQGKKKSEHNRVSGQYLVSPRQTPIPQIELHWEQLHGYVLYKGRTREPFSHSVVKQYSSVYHFHLSKYPKLFKRLPANINAFKCSSILRASLARWLRKRT